jgi:uncharacterized protein YcbK (DUF882 family)
MQLTTNFALSEFTCHDVAGTPVPVQYLDNVQLLANNLQVLRDALGVPVRVLCGYRTPAHNKAVGGVKQSQHLVAKAGDLTVAMLTPKELHAKIEELIEAGKMKQGGLGLYPGFVHYDVRGNKARW